MIKTITKDDYIEKSYAFYIKACTDNESELISFEEFKKTKVCDNSFMRDLMQNEFADINAFENGVYTYPEGYRHRLNIRLDTESDIIAFQTAINDAKGSIILTGTDGEEFVQINAKSIIGAIYAMTWAKITVISDEDIYFKIKEFVL